MNTTHTAGLSSIIIILIGAAAIGAGALMSDNQPELASSTMVSTSTEASSTAVASVEEEGMKRTVSSDSELRLSVDLSSEANSSPAVTYSNNGFSPQSLSVFVGSTIQFRNQSGSSMWVASDIHPTHEDYSGTSRSEHCPDLENDNFDQCGSGDIFSFTFQKAGEFNYHNHQNSEHGGVIIVSEE